MLNLYGLPVYVNHEQKRPAVLHVTPAYFVELQRAANNHDPFLEQQVEEIAKVVRPIKDEK